MRRLLPLLTGLVVVVTAATASGQIRVEAEDAAAARDEAAVALGSAEVERSVVVSDLVTTVAEWDAALGDQTALAFEVAELRNELASVELRADGLKDSIRARAVDAYMSGGVSLLDTVLVADSLADIATAQIVLDSLNRQADAELEELEEGRAAMETLRAELTTEEDRLQKHADDVATLVDQLDILFAEADATVTAAHGELLAADEEYRAAYELLQQMIALQRSAGPGTERWRPIVEHYFPPERVDQALEVMWCESRGNPKATHPLSGASGLFQFMEGTWEFVAPRAGFAGASRYDPEANIASAAWLLEFTVANGHVRGDWGRWTCQPVTP